MIGHNLVPEFILEQLARGQRQGEFDAVGLFVDVSGFTALTETLMTYGTHGAEVLAQVMRAVFSPMIEMVYAHGGFVANFAGDAFTALFPHTAPAAPLAAAWRLMGALARRSDHDTVYGTFTFSARAGLAPGPVRWRIFTNQDETQAAFYFRGGAVEDSATAEKHAAPGDILALTALAELVAAEFEPVTPRFQRLRYFDPGPLPPLTLPQADIQLQARFFPESLLRQAESGEFRQVFNVFINLQGDPDDRTMADFMDVLFSLQQRYGGLLNRIDFGDKGCHLLLFWGAPQSYENDARQVMNFLLGLRARSPLTIRAGVTYRVAHAGFVGAAFREEFTCYGRGVNLAARFMQAATWGEIWMDEALATRLEAFSRYDFLGARSFKGFDQAVPVFALRARREEVTRPQRRLVGRAAELAALTDFSTPLAQERWAGMALVSGEAGVGKSRLLETFLESCAILDEAALYFCPADEYRRQALRPFRVWLREYFEQSPLSAAENKENFDQILDWLIDDCDDTALAEELNRVRSFLGALLNLFWPDSLYEHVEPQLRFENTLSALRTLLLAETRRQPVLLVVEDGQWLDSASQTFLARLQRNPAAAPLGVIISSRDRPDWLVDPALELTLAPLDNPGARAFTANFLGREPAGSLVDTLWRRTGGNPYFLEQLLLYLRENDLLEAISELTDLDSVVPGDVQAVLVARLDRLDRPVRGTVQTAAVLGREFNLTVLAVMRAGAGLSAEIAGAAGANIWQPTDANHYVFQQALMRDAAYNMQLQSQLQTQHALAAQAYEQIFVHDLAPYYDQIAFHFDRADQVVRALPYYERAADQARSNYQNETALAHYRRALALAPAADDETRYRLLCGREAIFGWLGRREEQRADLAQLAELAGRLDRPALQADVSLRQAAYALVTGDYPLALTEAQASLAHARRADEAAAMTRAYHRWGRILWQQGDYAAARPHLLQALTLADSDTLAAQCLYDLSVTAYYQNEFTQAREYLAAAIGHYDAAHDRQGEITCLNLLGLIAHKQGDLDGARANYEKSLALCQAVGWRYAEGRNWAHLGSNAYTIGEYEDADRQHQRAVLICRELGDREGEAASLDTLGLIAQARGLLAEAEDYFRQSLAIQVEIDNQRGLGYTYTHLGQNLLAGGRPAAAVEHLQRALALRQAAGAQALQMDTLASLALAWARQGLLAEAGASATEVQAFLAENGPAGIELPATVYLHLYETLRLLAPAAPAREHQADAILSAAHDYITAAAAAIQNPEQQACFQEQVPEHRQLLAAWRERIGSQRS